MWNVDTIRAPREVTETTRHRHRAHPDGRRVAPGAHAHPRRRDAHAPGDRDHRARRRTSTLARRHVRRARHRLPHARPPRRRHGRAAQRRPAHARHRLRRGAGPRPGRQPRLHRPHAGALRRSRRSARPDPPRLLQRGLLRARRPAAASASPSRTCSSGCRGRDATAWMPPTGTAEAPSSAALRSSPSAAWRPASVRRASAHRSPCTARAGDRSTTTRFSPAAWARSTPPSTPIAAPLACAGSMQVLAPGHVLLGRGLSLGQRISYLSSLTDWLGAWRSLGYLAGPRARPPARAHAGGRPVVAVRRSSSPSRSPPASWPAGRWAAVEAPSAT